MFIWVLKKTKFSIMEINSIIWVIVVIALIVPFYMVGRKISKTKSKVIEQLNDLAAKSKCKIDEFDYWNKSAIGIDKTNKVVFLVKTKKDQTETLTTSLSQIKYCKPLVNCQSAENQKVFEKIQLNLMNKNNGLGDTLIEFYNIEYDSLTLHGELQLQEKWEKIINTSCSQIK
jgi:hypothetical protein